MQRRRTFRAGALLAEAVDAQRFTRRSLVLAAGGALAGRVARPASALGAALAGPPAPALELQALGALAPGVRTVALARNADLLGLIWDGVRDAHVRLRFRTRAERWSAWAPAGACAHGPEHATRSPLAPGAVVGEPVWSGGTRVVQLHSDVALADVRLALIDVSAGAGAAVAARAAARSPLAMLASSLPLATPVLQAGAGQPPIIARAAWARASAPPKVAPAYGDVRLAFVHHTENPNGYSAREVPAMLRAIFAFHRYVNGWDDIGYNFVIDAFGRTFEARAGGIDEPVCGAHAGGYNLVSTGVAVLGSFMATPISPAAKRALQRLLAWKLSLHGVPSHGRVTVRVNPAGASYSRFPANALVPLPRIAGHRDADSTDCPGDVLYGELGGVRRAVDALAPDPVRASLALLLPGAEAPPLASSPGAAQPPVGEAAPPPSGALATPTLTGELVTLEGTPVVGASVQVQQRSVARLGELVQERTLAQAVTDARGAWSLPVTLTPASASGEQLALRALYAGAVAGAGGPAGAGASVSEPLDLALAAVAPQTPTSAQQATQPGG
jgi:N-acetylmuramoyl-L-alanine amidase